MKHGPNKVKATVYRYGSPPTISALAALMDDEAERAFWRTYMADTNCRVIHMFSKDSKLPYFSNLVNKRTAREDNRTGREILEYVKNEVKKRRKEGAKNETV